MAANSPIHCMHSHAFEIARQNALIRRVVEEALTDARHLPRPEDPRAVPV